MVSKIKKVKPPKAMRVKTLVGRKRGKGEGLTNEEGLTKGSGLVTKKVGENLKPVKEIVTGKNIRKTIMAKEGSSKNKQGEKTMTKKKYGYSYQDRTKRKDTDSYVSKLKSKEKGTAKSSYPKTTGQFKINPGDNLTKISKMTGKSIKEIRDLNPDIVDANKIRAGAGLKGLGKRSDYTTTTDKKTTTNKKATSVGAGSIVTISGGRKKGKSATQINRELKAKVNPKKPTTAIFKVKKGESTTRAADAKKKQEAAQKKVGRGLTVKGEATPRKLSNEERRKNERLKHSFRIANQMKEGPGRDRAMERARKYMRKPLRGKLVDGPKAAERYSEILGTKNKNIKVANKAFGSNASDYTEIRMNTKSKGKGAGAAVKGMGAVVK